MEQVSSFEHIYTLTFIYDCMCEYYLHNLIIDLLSFFSFIHCSKQLVSLSMEFHDLEDQVEGLKASNDNYCQQLSQVKEQLSESDRNRKQLEIKEKAYVDQVRMT